MNDAEFAADIRRRDLLARADEIDAAERTQWVALFDALANLTAKLSRLEALVEENGKKIDKLKFW